uniref:BZIP domain-containing protein n=1 Tax=Opuntia streptacantha TaxID=393608 RepID=A0A7C8Z3J6_OPUST
MQHSSSGGGGRPPASSGSEGCGGGIDEKKRRRMESNRESARRSRQKKQQHLDDLIREVGMLKRDNEEFSNKIEQFSGQFAGADAQNKVLRAEKERLVRRLESLESVIEIAKMVKGEGSNNNNVNGEEGLGLYDSDPMMKPWQLPCPSSIAVPLFASPAIRSFNC